MTCGRTSWLLVLSVGLVACWTDENEPGGGPLGNGIYCYDLNCKDLLTIDVLRRDNEAFVPGEYTFSLGPDEPQVACVFSPDGALSYDGATDLMAVSLNQARDMFTIRFDVTPREIFLEVLLDDAVIGSEVLVPSYQVITSQDPECLDTCTQGSASMNVQSPPTE